MPQGKGTYGSQVGRPSKKKYKMGGSVDPFSTKNPDAIEQISEPEMPGVQEAGAPELEQQAEQGLPETNAMERSETYAVGGEVGTGVYKNGGEVDITNVVKKVAEKVAQEKRFDKRIAEADKKGETIQSGPDTLPMSDLHKYNKKGHSALKKSQIKKMEKEILKKKRKKK